MGLIVSYSLVRKIGCFEMFRCVSMNEFAVQDARGRMEKLICLNDCSKLQRT